MHKLLLLPANEMISLIIWRLLRHTQRCCYHTKHQVTDSERILLDKWAPRCTSCPYCRVNCRARASRIFWKEENRMVMEGVLPCEQEIQLLTDTANESTVTKNCRKYFSMKWLSFCDDKPRSPAQGLTVLVLFKDSTIASMDKVQNYWVLVWWHIELWLI